MANAEHVRLLVLQGVEGWNQWRKAEPGICPDLSGVEIVKAVGPLLSGIDLTWANLRKADLSSADLTSSALQGVEAWDAALMGVNLEGAILVQARLIRANMHGSNLTNAIISNANLSGAVVTNANLAGADLSAANISAANLAASDLSGANLVHSFAGGSNLSKANLSKANLKKAILTWANLSGATVEGADFTDSEMWRTVLGDLDLSSAQGLSSVVHYGPSSLGVDTIYRSRGKIPEAFLRGVGVPDNLIRYVDSLVDPALEFYSCFISFSSKDQDFASKLYADLQAANVTCWFAPEDLRIGDRIRPRIDESIRMHDKLLLILSEHSVLSGWVEAEVETALAREREHGRAVLFPVRLDDSVMEIKAGWPALIRNTRHVGDLRGWKQDAPYRKGLERLLRDLKAGSRIE